MLPSDKILQNIVNHAFSEGWVNPKEGTNLEIVKKITEQNLEAVSKTVDGYTLFKNYFLSIARSTVPIQFRNDTDWDAIFEAISLRGMGSIKYKGVKLRVLGGDDVRLELVFELPGSGDVEYSYIQSQVRHFVSSLVP